jgi:hypothetical protein
VWRDKRYSAIFDDYDTAVTSISSATKKCVVGQITYAPADEAVLDALLRELKGSPEWRVVEREIDIQVVGVV